ncbi:MAG: hypothetical protein WAV31_06335 [Candidatus Moraniibacteriota bacterium]
MNIFDGYAFIFLIFAFIVFVIYVVFDMAMTADTNAFLNNWAKKTAWLWLPFYAMQRLIKEVLLKKK